MAEPAAETRTAALYFVLHGALLGSSFGLFKVTSTLFGSVSAMATREQYGLSYIAMVVLGVVASVVTACVFFTSWIAFGASWLRMERRALVAHVMFWLFVALSGLVLARLKAGYQSDGLLLVQVYGLCSLLAMKGAQNS
ncbi:MAG: hypothetical protein H6812_06130 [Phycisphaeraceae bacterium]|nr:hypothetical protein [Phycisphaerales bacterium]MCB9842821.1 hypothetical protein [Phycisphaeraceae bacterium]